MGVSTNVSLRGFLSTLALLCVYLTLAVHADGSQDLGSVLAGEKDLSTYYGLIQVRLVSQSEGNHI